MMRNLGVFLAGIAIGVMGMGGTVYYLRNHYAMSMLPWIMLAAALVLVLLIVIAWLLQKHRANKFQKVMEKNGTAPASKPSHGFHFGKKDDKPASSTTSSAPETSSSTSAYSTSDAASSSSSYSTPDTASSYANEGSDSANTTPSTPTANSSYSSDSYTPESWSSDSYSFSGLQGMDSDLSDEELAQYSQSQNK